MIKSTYIDVSDSSQKLLSEIEHPTSIDEFFQLSLDVIYDRDVFEGITNVSIWSDSFESIQDWGNAVKNEDSFHVGRNVEYLKAEVAFSET